MRTNDSSKVAKGFLQLQRKLHLDPVHVVQEPVENLANGCDVLRGSNISLAKT